MAALLAEGLLMLGVEAVQDPAHSDELADGIAQSFWKFSAVIWLPLSVNFSLRNLTDALEEWGREDQEGQRTARRSVTGDAE